MKCPICNDIDLVMSERSGIEIDYCPQCRGIWLDRGELDKIIERSTHVQATASIPQERPIQKTDNHWGSRTERYDEQRSHDDHNRPENRKKSFFQELFD